MRTSSARLTAISAVVIVIAVLSSCGSNTPTDTATLTTVATTTTAAAPPTSPTVAVEMRLVSFKPERFSAKVGEPVRWIQRDPGFHTVTSGAVEQGAAGVTAKPDALFDSGNVATDATFEHTFDKAGTYPYFCAIHPATMRGSVEVS